MKFSFGILLCIPLLLWTIFRTVNCITFSIDCGQHMKRAAHANSVEMAQKEMVYVVKYCEDHRLTEGTVSIILHQPKNDVGFWYNNMKACLAELDTIINSKDTSTTEASRLSKWNSCTAKTNALMKLRETLVAHGEKGDRTVCPNGITIYPNNVIYCIWGIIGLILLIPSVYLICRAIDEL